MANTKTIRPLMLTRRLAAVSILCLLILSAAGRSLKAQTVTEGYNADTPLQTGMLIKLKDKDATKIEPVSQDNVSRMHGVVVDANDAPVTLSAAGQRYFVATTGHFKLLVTNQNGPVATGDYVSVSALPGIGMKAGDQQSVVAGKALSSFDGQTNVISKIDVKQSDGTTRSLAIGRIDVDMGIAHNPLVKPADTNLPGFLKKASEAIGGKQVSASRVYLSLGIFMATTMASGAVLYAGVRSSVTALGRNPLSKKVISRSLVQIILTSLIIFTFGTFGVYLLLRA